jgi:aerobic C4-dicarboxylate transport protein
MEVDLNAEPIKPKPWYRQLYIQVLVAIVIGITLGAYYPDKAKEMRPLADGFINLIKMVIAPVIFITITVGIASMNDLKKVGRVTGKAFVYFLTFSTLALIIGIIIANIVRPGDGFNFDPTSIEGTAEAAKLGEYQDSAKENSLTHFILDIIPKTFMSSLTGENILQVLFAAILFGIALSVTSEKSKPVIDFFQALANPIFKIVEMLMKLAPIGAFGAMAFTVGQTGVSSLLKLGELVLTFYGTAAFFVLVVLGIVARYNGFSIFKLIRYLKEEIFLVLGTSSSEPALPGVMRKMEKAGCSSEVVGLVIPTGYSFNLDGTNIYMTLAALFVAQACNVELTFSQQITLLLVAMLSSKGAAGVSGAGFITLAATLTVFKNVPIEGMTLIFGVDKFMSECRALTNFIGNAVATIVVARWEKQLDPEALKKALK